MDFKLFLIKLLLVFGLSYASKKTAKFVVETVAERSDIKSYKKVGTSSYFGLFGQNTKAKCTIVCLHEDNCRSVHMEGGACVFGVGGDVTAFEEDGEDVHPNRGQRIHAKSTYQF